MIIFQHSDPTTHAQQAARTALTIHHKTRQINAEMFLDVMMPKKNGSEVCETVKQDPDLQGIYVILLTAKGRRSTGCGGRTCGPMSIL